MIQNDNKATAAATHEYTRRRLWFIPLMSQEDEDNMNQQEMPDVLSILPLRNTVLFPGVVIPITVGRDKSINLIKDNTRAIR